MNEGPKVRTLRHALRDACDADHRLLDDSMASLDLAQRADYARFLSIQLAARVGVEVWLERHCPAVIRPPSQRALVAADLAELGCESVAGGPAFDAPEGADPLGVAWVLAGAHLGNRAMLAGLAKSGKQMPPVRFLSDPAMIDYWARLRPLLERPADPATTRAAIAAAKSVFAHFQALAKSAPAGQAA